MNNFRQTKKGMVLVLSILIISTILASSAIFANLIIRQIQQVRLIDQSIQAYYLAESGVERAMHQVRKREAVKYDDCDLVQAGSVCQPDGVCSGTAGEVFCITTNEGDLEVLGNWQVSTENENETTVWLDEGDSFQIELFSPYQVLDSNGNGIESFRIQTDLGGYAMAGEITNVTWLTGETPDCYNGYAIPKPAIVRGDIIFNDLGSTPYLTKFDSDDPEIDPDCFYTLRISNAKFPSAQGGQFTISIFSKSQDVDPLVDRLAIPSRLIINSQATFGQSLQRLTVRTPMRPPVSGLYDFVLFSEVEIVK
ncbi:MAG: hypothetical protein RB292_00205 [Patescibacteria group bacterium]|jgi:hypothetical protein|nr:hypothetical protein [Patescibacteria group bacterium]